jgi:hypothetical protein
LNRQIEKLASPVDLRLELKPNAEPFPGKKSDWHGFDRYDFPVGGKTATVVAPKQAAVGRPWVWHGEFLGHKPAPDIALLDLGFHIVYLSVPDMLGCPDAVAQWNVLYRELTRRYGFAQKVALVGLSRGGLYCYNWAARSNSSANLELAIIRTGWNIRRRSSSSSASMRPKAQTRNRHRNVDKVSD